MDNLILNNAYILKKPDDIIKYTGALILEKINEIKAGEKITVIFPNKRPCHFLAKYLSEAYGASTDKITIVSIDDFIDRCYETYAQNPFPKINPAEATLLLFDLNRKKETAIIKNAETLDAFMPWGYKLFGDFEELLIELTDPALCDSIIAENISRDVNLLNFSDKFSKFSQMYKIFYETLAGHMFSSRSYRYKFIAGHKEASLAALPGKVITVGFYGINASESAIFKEIFKNKAEDAVFITKEGAKIPDLFKKIGLLSVGNEKAEDSGGGEIFYGDAPSKFYFNNTSSIHNEIMQLRGVMKELKNRLPFSSKDLILLPAEDYLFPLLHNVLSLLRDDDYNVSIGYSLKRTPLYSLFNLMAVLHGRKKKDIFYAEDYVSLFLHPYVKNIRRDKDGFKSEQTRMLFQSIESYIKKNKILFISLKDLENIEPVAASESPIKDHFVELNDIFISNFENIKNIKDFIEKIIKIIDVISNSSVAYKHPYGKKFVESALTELMEFENINFSSEEISNAGSPAGGSKGIDISLYKFDGISGYFNLLKNILKHQNVPFRGTPLKGLQVLGPLEARFLNFDRVFYLGANEGIAPDVSKENTILTENVRNFLNIPTANESARIQEYNFFNLIAGAKEVHFFYNESKSSEKSRFIEKIIWDIQKKSKNLNEPETKNSAFKINFTAEKEPPAVKKSEEVKEYLCGMDYSTGKLDAYLKCPMMFYYAYVLNLKKSDDIGSDIDAPGVGNIIHSVLKEYFGRFLKKEYIVSDLKDETAEIHRILDKNFNSFGSKVLGLQKKQILLALNTLIKSKHQDIYGAKVIGVEYPMETFISYGRCEQGGPVTESERKIGSSDKTVKLTGRADLILEKDGRHFIIDYKTGNISSWPNENLISNPPEWFKKAKSVQLPFYIVLYNYSNAIIYSNITAKLWGIKKSMDYSIDFSNNEIFGSYVSFIRNTIDEIINSDYFDFPQKENDKKVCGYCSYSLLCGRI